MRTLRELAQLADLQRALCVFAQYPYSSVTKYLTGFLKVHGHPSVGEKEKKWYDAILKANHRRFIIIIIYFISQDVFATNALLVCDYFFSHPTAGFAIFFFRFLNLRAQDLSQKPYFLMNRKTGYRMKNPMADRCVRDENRCQKNGRYPTILG